MNILLDLLVIGTLAFCAWQGYKRGIIGSVLAVIFVIVAIYGANLVATTYSQEFTSMFRPFVSGYLDSAERTAIEEIVPEDHQGLSTEDLFRIEPEIEPLIVRQVFIDLGVHHSRAEDLTQRYLTYRTEYELSVNRAMTDVLVYAFCFFIVYVIGFLLIIIALTVIYNVIPVSFRLPGRKMKLVDEIGGGVFGFTQGVMLIFMLAWALGYAGLLFPDDFLARTWITELFIGANPMVGPINL
ncbi:MAG: CvpA family protein [Oscillospiraceae bacterium]|nr:CvpA family protein [Oscillospiraceae bacterium]